jgi:N-acetyltransferase
VGEKAFLCVKAGKVVGCVLVEKVDGARPLLGLGEGGAGHGGEGAAEEDGGQGLCYSLEDGEERPKETLLGVRQMWVSRAHRRQGVATALIEAARARFFFGLVVPREAVAFSQLSTMGKAFARAYASAAGTVLVY